MNVDIVKNMDSMNSNENNNNNNNNENAYEGMVDINQSKI